jgi:hypothetical protein
MKEEHYMEILEVIPKRVARIKTFGNPGNPENPGNPGNPEKRIVVIKNIPKSKVECQKYK